MVKTVLLFFFLSSNIVLATEQSVRKVIKEAENLTILQDRMSACSTIFKAYKKNSGSDAKTLKDKLFYFSKYFYTDKGFQNYLSGKELFSKEKFVEATEKFNDADQLEKSNTDVLHAMTISNLWSKKIKPAQEANVRALQINPLDTELLKDKLATEIGSEDWVEAVMTADEMIQKNEDTTALTYYFRGIAQEKTQKAVDAKKSFEMALAKDKKYPETYFRLSEFEDDPKKKQGFLTTYNELCKNKKQVSNERDLNLCSRTTVKSL